MIEEQIEDEYSRKAAFFFFVNSKSGNQQGSKLLQLSKYPQQFDGKINLQTSILFIDIFDQIALQQGISTLTWMTDTSDDELYVVACGGDGTMSWLVNKLFSHIPKLQLLIFGILPIGTGNDMSRSLGWGSQIQVQINSLVNIINDWLQAEIKDYDIWKVTFKTFEDGKIFDIQNKVEKESQTTEFSRLFTNYWGLGLDGRIVYTMERYRTSSTFINRILYTLVGCYNIFRPLRQLHTSITSFTQKVDIGKEPSEGSNCSSSISSDTRSNKRVYGPSGRKKIKLKSGYRGLVCLNTTSYMSGVKNIWETSSVATKQIQKNWKNQTSNDGLIQFLAFKSELNMAMERVVSSASKVAQGSGPFQIVMERPDKSQTTFFEIDGESIKVVNLKSIEVERGVCSCIKVLSKS